MKIITLIENTACQDALAAEHGLSLYIETGAHKILFDAGQTAAFADNAEMLGVDLSQVDICILSHGHYDHGGGLKRFLEINDTAPVYVSRYAFEGHYGSPQRYIGLDQTLLESGRIRFVEDSLALDAGLTLFSCNDRQKPFAADNYGLLMLEDDLLKADNFRHEQYLLAEEDGKRILFSGCSHKGILNIVHWFQPDVLIGGFHFMKLEDPAALTNAARQLARYHTAYYTGHCTGQVQYAHLKRILGDNLNAISGGVEITL